MKALVTRRFPGHVSERLKDVFDDVRESDDSAPLDRKRLLDRIRGVEVAVVSLTEIIDEEVLTAADKLKLIVTFSVGVDHIDLAAVKKRGIRLVHTPDVLTPATADLTLALVLASARRLKPGARFVEEGRFTGFDPDLFLGLELGQSVLGVVGLGKIGSAVAQRAIAFGMKVIYVSPSEKKPEFEATRMDLPTALQRSDIVTLHCPLNEKTRGMIGVKELQLLKPKACLVNTARGPLIDEKALYAHLRTRPECFAALDVFENEPEVVPGLASLPNALCLPHLGSATAWARGEMARVCWEEAQRFAKGEKLRYEYRFA